MAWILDTCVLLDILLDDPDHGKTSALCAKRHLSDGLVVSPVSYAELAPAFEGDADLQNTFLTEIGAHWLEPWTWTDTVTSHRLWNNYVHQKRTRGEKKSPIADLLIAGYALRFQGIITRNVADFRSLSPSLRVVVPE